MAKEKQQSESAENVLARKVIRGPHDEVLDPSTLEALMNASPDNTITPRRQAEIVKGNANPAGCWMHSPARVELNAMADRRLTKAAGLGPDGVQVRQVDRVHLDLIPGTKVIAIRYASSNDETATKVNRYPGTYGASINMIDLLGDQGLTVDRGYKEYYAVFMIPEGSPFYPGIGINLGLRLNRRKTKGSEQESPQAMKRPASADTASEETAAAEAESDEE